MLTAEQVVNLPNPIVVPEFDQRGAPFARVRDGDGDGTPEIDMGIRVAGTASAGAARLWRRAGSDAGTGVNNYNTLAGDNGPSHAIVPGLRLGASVDSDLGTLQTPTPTRMMRTVRYPMMKTAS